MVGASPLISAAYHDEGTIEALNLLGLEVSSVGNHEFDAGRTELLRKQHGGCFRPSTYSCLERGTFLGAAFTYLAANVVITDTGKTLFLHTSSSRWVGSRLHLLALSLKRHQALCYRVELPVLSVGMKLTRRKRYCQHCARKT
jgi:5'-nucleotidase